MVFLCKGESSSSLGCPCSPWRARCKSVLRTGLSLHIISKRRQGIRIQISKALDLEVSGDADPLWRPQHLSSRDPSRRRRVKPPALPLHRQRSRGRKQRLPPPTRRRAAFLLSTLLFPWTYRPATLDRQGQYGEEPNEESF